MTGAAAASYEWAVSVDGEDWTVVETETDETFDVTADLVGMYVKVTVTAEDGETASDVTTEPVEPFGIIEIESAEATKVNEIEVLLAYSIDPDDTVVTVTKGLNDVPATVAWNDDCDIATITTEAKMAKGTYTVTVSSVEDPTNTDSETVEIKDQEVAEIVILNDVALTDTTKKIAYAYYDVLDQYGASLRASTSIQWAGSAADITYDKTNGQIELKKNGAADWVYNEKIYLTGVYTKTGVSTSKELLVGTEQNLDTIEMVGFVKMGTSTIIPAKEGLPADFKAGEYYLLFNALDQNGNVLAADEITRDDVTFVSDNVLVVKELTNIYHEGLSGMTIAGTEYCAVEVTPGIKVADGGEVTVTAIANKTGNKTEVNFMVGEDPVVVSFDMKQPTVTVADGDQGVEIPFEAKDENGNTITNFRTLAKQKTFNTLTFSASEGALVLAEQDNGTAKLTWSDDTTKTGWGAAITTDGIDRPISLTAIVVGGDTDNEMISVSDKRRPDAVADVNMKSVYVEGATITFVGAGGTTKKSFKFYDQYGELITTPNDDWGDDNGFFAAAATGTTLNGTEFAGYDFGVRIKNAGSGKIVPNVTALDPEITGVISDDGKEFVVTNKAVETTAQFVTTTDIESAATGEGFKFEIAKFKAKAGVTRSDASDWEAVSTSKYMPVTVVDITQVKNLTIGDLDTIYVGQLQATVPNPAYEVGGTEPATITGTITGDGIISSNMLGFLKDTPVAVAHVAAAATARTGGINVTGDYRDKAKVTVSGTYNGATVDVPYDYFKDVKANKLTASLDGDDDTWKFDGINSYNAGTNTKGLQAADLYDKSSAKGTAKNATDEVTATILKKYDGSTYFWGWDATTNTKAKYTLAEYGTIAATQQAADDSLDADALAAAIKRKQLDTINGILTISADLKNDTELGTFMAAGGNGDFAAGGVLTTAQTDYDDAVTAKATSALALEDAASALTDDVRIAADALYQTDTALKAASVNDVTTAVTNAATIAAGDKTAAETYLQAKRTDLLNDDDVTAKTAALDLAEKKAAYTAADAIQTAENSATAGDNTLTTLFDDLKNLNAGTLGAGFTEVYDTAKATVTLSDQAPKATAIKGLEDSYTFNPFDTDITNANIGAELKDVKVVDQYGVKTGDALTLTVTGIEESASGYAEHNFKVTQNGTTNAAINGAEREDTFTLIVSVGEIKESTAVTVGADGEACIINSYNMYREDLEPTLDEQRIAGLG